MFKGKLKYLACLLVVAAIFNGCTDDNPADPNVPGSDRDKYVGSWLCRETQTGQAPITFTITIEKHGTEDTLYVYNFNLLGSSQKAIWLISDNSVTIPTQSITQIVVSGSGFYNNGKINLNYSSDGDQYSAECTK